MNRLLQINKLFALRFQSRFFSFKTFEEAKDGLSKLKNEPDNNVKLKIYALYKQSTEGDCNAPEPGMFEIVKKAKWEAWNSLKSKSKDEAVKEYIEMISSLAENEKSEEVVKDDQVKTENDPLNSTGDLILEKKDNILRITLNRPDKYNALNLDMYKKWTKALQQANVDESVKLVIVSGNGKYFSSGNDLKNFTVSSDVDKMIKEAKTVLQHFVASFIDLEKPIVAFVHGPAIGITVTTMALYDYVVASDEATFSTPFTKLAHTPEGCSSLTFPLIMGRAKANGMLMFNETMTASEAFDCGFVGKVVPKDDFEKYTKTFAKDLVSLPPLATFYSKELICEEMRDRLHQVNTKECQMLADRWASDEFKEVIVKKLAKLGKK